MRMVTHQRPDPPGGSADCGEDGLLTSPNIFRPHEATMQLSSLPRPVGFVLGGGGSLGAVQVGMLQALAERGVLPDLVVGTSVGSLNGAVLAMDP